MSVLYFQVEGGSSTETFSEGFSFSIFFFFGCLNSFVILFSFLFRIFFVGKKDSSPGRVCNN